MNLINKNLIIIIQSNYYLKDTQRPSTQSEKMNASGALEFETSDPAMVMANARDYLLETRAIRVIKCEEELPADVFKSYHQLLWTAQSLDFKLYCMRRGYEGDELSGAMVLIGEIHRIVDGDEEQNHTAELEEKDKAHESAKEEFDKVMENYPELEEKRFWEAINIELGVQDVWRQARAGYWDAQRVAAAYMEKYPELTRAILMQPSQTELHFKEMAELKEMVEREEFIKCEGCA